MEIGYNWLFPSSKKLDLYFDFAVKFFERSKKRSGRILKGSSRRSVDFFLQKSPIFDGGNKNHGTIDNF